MSNPIIDVINNQLIPVEALKEANQKELKNAIERFKTIKDPFLAMAFFMQNVMMAKQGSGTFVGNQEDKIREVAVQKSVMNSFSSALSSAQDLFNRAKTDPTIKPSDVAAKFTEIKDALVVLQNKTGSPFDEPSRSAMWASADNLWAKFKGMKDDPNGLTQLYQDAAKTGADGSAAAGTIKDINDQISTISTTTTTQNNALSTMAQMYNGDYQQWLGLGRDLLQNPGKVIGATVQNQKG